MVFKAGESQGKSGSFFFFSQDQRFIIKTMTEEDFGAFRRIQKKYFQRVSTDEESLLARIYGIYSVRMEDQNPVKLVVMGNALQGATHHLGCFDLKGSTVGRVVKGTNFKGTATLKDLNIIQLNGQRIWLRFKDADIRKINNNLREDVKMLAKFNMMDYSLLVCVQENPRFSELMA